jgi:LacI family transcriptional regulator
MSDGSRTAPRRAVTRSDVARYAGVSTAVVSYVVNNGPRKVAPATEAKVRDAIDRLGYRPNLSARALRLGATEMIGLVVPDSSNPFFAEYGQAVERAAAERGHALVMANSASDGALERRHVESLASRQVDGILVASTLPRRELALSRHQEVTTVLLNLDGPVPGYHTLGPDFTRGTVAVVGHLLEVHGARTVALATGHEGPIETNSREQGWREALWRSGQPDGPVVRGEYTRDGGYAMGRALLQQGRPDAVFATSDLQAVGVLRALHEAGLRVPQDIALVSFDGTSESEFCWPALTVARQPVAEMAQAAVAAVLDRRSPHPDQHQLFQTELVLRRSCGCGP